MAAPTNMAPYKIQKRGTKWVVVNNAGEVKASFTTRSAALDYQRALYANVKGAPKKAEKTPWTGKEKPPKEDAAMAPGDANAPKKDPLGTNKPKNPLANVHDGKPPAGTPAHHFVPSGSGSGCLVCGGEATHELHSIVKLNQERTDPLMQPDAAAEPITMSDGKYPIASQSDANDAWKLRNNSKNHSEAEVVAHIRRACKKLGLKFPGDNDSAADAQQTDDRRGTMVALFPDKETAGKLAVPGGEKSSDLHVTLAFLPDFDATQDDTTTLLATVEGFARSQQPLTGEVSGQGKFIGGQDGDVHYASIDLPDLPEFRQALVRVLTNNGFKVSDNHGYTPHMTLAYGDAPEQGVAENHPLEFPDLWVAAGPTRHSFPLGSPDTEAAGLQSLTDDQERRDAAKIAAGLDAGVDQAIVLLRSCNDDVMPEYALQARDLLQALEPACDELLEYFGVPDADDREDSNPEFAAYLSTLKERAKQFGAERERVLAEARHYDQTFRTGVRVSVPEGHAHPEPPTAKAFVTELSGRTVLTGPASAFSGRWDTAATPNPYFSWMQGRFVGGEEPNRNNAFWSTADLEMGAPTVKHGPLNWLHESKHVIGSIADARLISRDEAKDEDLSQPYIAALAGIWRWIYPDEAAVVEMASDAGKLWYSMECVSRVVNCAGESGCGKEFPYVDVMTKAATVCSHLLNRSSVRHLVDPTFLGGAVIVPPVRPGWAHADARVLAEAAKMAEKSFDAAGRPDMTASEWELLMAQVVSFATS